VAVATRFWLTSSAPPYTPTTRRGSWAVASGEDVQYLGRKPAGAAGSSTINVGSTAANRDVLLHRSISDGAVKAGTLAGTVQWVIGAKESNANLNGFFHLHIYVTSGDSDTPRGTLLTDSIGATEFGTTAVGATEGSKTLSSVSVQVGDRIVVEIGYRASASATTQNATINYGNTGTTDLTNGSASVTSQPGWIEFSAADGLFTKSFSALTDQFPSSIDSKWTASAGVSVVSGRARINCTTAVPNMFTATAYEIQASTLAFKVPTVPAAGGGSTVTFSGYLMPSAGSTTNLEFEYSPNTGNLVLRNSVGGTDASPTTLTYDPSAHLWWRYREASGQIFMETSPDNSTWTTRRTISTPSQWMLQGSLVAYFEAGRASGTADFAEIDDINPPSGLSATVGTASETDTAQALSRVKTKAGTLASETDTAQALSRTKRVTLGIASEGGTGQALGRRKAKAVPIAAAADAAQLVGMTLGLHIAAAMDAAQPVGKAKRLTLGTALETGTGQPIPVVKSRAVTAAQEADAGQGTPTSHRAALGTAAAVDTAQAVSRAKRTDTAPSTEAGAAQPLGTTKRTTAAPSQAVDAALAITARKGSTVTPAAAAEAARPLGVAKRITLGAATAEETATRVAAGGGIVRNVDRAIETDAAQPIERTKTTATGRAAASDTAQPLTVVRRYTLSPAGETATALPAAAAKTAVLGPAYDYGAAVPPHAVKTAPTAYATDSNTAQPLRAVRTYRLATATETATACPPHAAKARLLTGAVHTDTAQTLTTPSSGQAHGLRIAGRPHTAWTARPAATAWASHGAHTAWTCSDRQGGDVNSLSTEFHEVPVAWTHGDPTSFSVDMAVIPLGHEPAAGDWHTAAWDTDSDGQTVAKLLVGPNGGAVALTPGTYRDWVQVDAPPEQPVLFTPPFEIS